MPRGTARNVMQTAEAFAGLAAGGPKGPQTFLNAEIGRDRRGGVRADRPSSCSRERAAGPKATVNDRLILTGPAGGLRRFCVRHR